MHSAEALGKENFDVVPKGKKKGEIVHVGVVTSLLVYSQQWDCGLVRFFEAMFHRICDMRKGDTYPGRALFVWSLHLILALHSNCSRSESLCSFPHTHTYVFR